VGRLVLGHTAPKTCGGWESTGHYEDNAGVRVSRILGQTPTRISYRSREVFERFACYVAFEAAHDLSG
jgi:hypothetical protein